MKKKGFLIIIILLFIWLVLPEKNENIRVRVIANSDEKIDQIYKNEVVKIMKSIIKCDDSYEDVENKMGVLEEELLEYGKEKDLKISVEFTKTKFPTKSLNDKVIEGGIFDTVLITIGKGEGKNYWSLLYPEYYGITFEDVESENIEVKFYLYEKIKMLIE